ncbi:unnamed protein product [Urochloa humidicola]
MACCVTGAATPASMPLAADKRVSDSLSSQRYLVILLASTCVSILNKSVAALLLGDLWLRSLCRECAEMELTGTI